MTETRTIPWIKIGAESLAIVASILLAFAINAWWATRQDRVEEQRILVSLDWEIQQNLQRVERELSYRNAVILSILELFDAAAGNVRLEPDAIDKLIGDITWWADGEYSRGAIDELIQSGKLSLIKNNDLRQLLASLPYLYEVTRQAELQDKDGARGTVNPYLSANAAFSQIANTMTEGRPGTGELSTAPAYPAIEVQDHSWLIGDREFLGILVREHWDHLDAIWFLESLRSESERAIELIEQETDRG